MSSQSSSHDLACQAPSVENFLQHGLYLRNWSSRTVRAYRYALRDLPPALTKSALDAWIVKVENLGYWFWAGIAVAWFVWLGFFQPSKAAAPRAEVPGVVAVNPTVAAPSPLPAAPTPAPIAEPNIAALDVVSLPGALPELPPLPPDVLPSVTLDVEPLPIAAGVVPTPLARPTSRRRWLGFFG